MLTIPNSNGSMNWSVQILSKGLLKVIQVHILPYNQTQLEMAFYGSRKILYFGFDPNNWKIDKLKLVICIWLSCTIVIKLKLPEDETLKDRIVDPKTGIAHIKYNSFESMKIMGCAGFWVDISIFLGLLSRYFNLIIFFLAKLIIYRWTCQ